MDTVPLPQLVYLLPLDITRSTSLVEYSVVLASYSGVLVY